MPELCRIYQKYFVKGTIISWAWSTHHPSVATLQPSIKRTHYTDTFHPIHTHEYLVSIICVTQNTHAHHLLPQTPRSPTDIVANIDNKFTKRFIFCILCDISTLQLPRATFSRRYACICRLTHQNLLKSFLNNIINS